MSTISVDNIKGRGITGNTINISSGNKLTGSTGSIAVPGTVMHQFAANDTLKFTVQSTATNFYGANSSNSVSSMMIFKVG